MWQKHLKFTVDGTKPLKIVFEGSARLRKDMAQALERYGDKVCEFDIFSDNDFRVVPSHEHGGLTCGIVVEHPNGNWYWDETYQVRSMTRDLSQGKEYALQYAGFYGIKKET